jgi:hypothetical protein
MRALDPDPAVVLGHVGLPNERQREPLKKERPGGNERAPGSRDGSSAKAGGVA